MTGPRRGLPNPFRPIAGNSHHVQPVLEVPVGDGKSDRAPDGLAEPDSREDGRPIRFDTLASASAVPALTARKVAVDVLGV